MSSLPGEPNAELEDVPPNEDAQIDRIVALTLTQLERRYKDAPPFRRGVHPKDHGCVEATFTVCEDIRPDLRVGLFKKPGAQFRAAIRFSNAAPLVTPDTPQDVGPPLGDLVFGPEPDKEPVLAHGSRGMAIKLYDVSGDRLVPDDGESTQDFLMINQPVFAFANVEDYEALSKAIVEDEKFAFRFFSSQMASTDSAVRMRALKSLAIVQEVKSRSVLPPPPFVPPKPFPPFTTLPFPYQAPPLSPLDNTYFSAAPFLFGKGRAMKFCARPVNPRSGPLGDAVNKADYLLEAMGERMTEAGGKDVCFDFQVQVRTAKDLADKIKTDIEDMCTLWEDEFVTVARITIPPQDVNSPERQKFCEALVYTPWHGLADHLPLGGINRMRRKVYEASAEKRGCPVSPNLPPAKGKGGGAMGDKMGGGKGLGGGAGKAVGGKGFGGKGFGGKPK